MDFDFLGDLAQAGSSGGRWKSLFAVLFGLFGAGLGGYVGFLTNGVVGAIGGACVGGFLGWFLAMVLTGMFLILGGVVPSIPA